MWECPTCGLNGDIGQIPKEAEITDKIETSESYDESGFYVQSIPKRSSEAGRKASQKRRQKKIKLDEDPEIDPLLRIYGVRVNVIK